MLVVYVETVLLVILLLWVVYVLLVQTAFHHTQVVIVLLVLLVHTRSLVVYVCLVLPVTPHQHNHLLVLPAVLVKQQLPEVNVLIFVEMVSSIPNQWLLV